MHRLALAILLLACIIGALLCGYEAANAQFTPIPDSSGATFRTNINNAFGGAVPVTPNLQGIQAATAAGMPIVAGKTNTATGTQAIMNGVLNVKAFGALGNGVANDGPAILTAFQAACPHATCTAALYFPAGSYLWTSSATGAAASLNGSLFANYCTLTNLTLLGDEGLLSSAEGAPALSRIIISDNAAQVGLSLVGDVGLYVHGLDIETPATATGPKALVMTGKASTCNATNGVFENSSIVSYAGTGTFAYYSMGFENVDFRDTEVRSVPPSAGVASGNALGFTATNATYNIVPGDMPLWSSAVSMASVSFTGKRGQIAIGGTSANPAYGVYIENGANTNLIRDYDFSTYWSSINSTATCTDVMVGDGLAATSYTYSGMRFDGIFETVCGTNNQQFIKIGRQALGWNSTVFAGSGTNPVVQPLAGAVNSNFNIMASRSGTAYSSGSNVNFGTRIWALSGATVTAPGAAMVCTDAGCAAPPSALATFGTCTSALEGAIQTETNSTAACSAGATATSAGTTHCQIRCNGTNWIQTGL